MAYRIGITERGDAGLDLNWTLRADAMDGLILVTKNCTPEFRRAAIRYKDKTIIHANCTGYGGTVLEPNVPAPWQQLNQIRSLVDEGFPPERIVLRVDPIVPTDKGLDRAKNIMLSFLEELPDIRRIRISVLDVYPHVRERFRTAGVRLPYGNAFSAPADMFHATDEMLRSILQIHPGIAIESCAEPELTIPERIGCVSEKDFVLLGLNPALADSNGPQRRHCLCASAKTELLNRRHPCPHACLYCYWKN